ncbi:MAG: carbonic anhydrase [Candidatus Velthaea sp.]
MRARALRRKAALARRLLEAGNARFVAGTLRRQDRIAERRRALTGGQAPFASVLACSDSRVVPEMIFDRHIGDLFVARIAGNVVTDAVLGTFEFGHSVLGIELIVVLGHEGCGAIAATYDALINGTTLPPHLDEIERCIRPNIAHVVAAGGDKDEASVANAHAQTAQLMRSLVLRGAAAAGDVTIVPAEYRLGSGRVVFLEQPPLTSARTANT